MSSMNMNSMMSIMVTWTNDMIFKLIDLYHERPLLWDSALLEYRDRYKKHEAWNEIAQHFNLDQITVEKKMKVLVSQFNREVNKPPGQVTKWFAYEKLSFLKSRKRPRQSAADRGEEDYKFQTPAKMTCLLKHERESSDASIKEEKYDDFKDERPFHPIEVVMHEHDHIPLEDKLISVSTSDSAELFGRTIGSQLKEVSQLQRCIAEKLMSEIMFHAKLDQLTMDSCIALKPSTSGQTSRDLD